jgi:mRNA interferase YafQ
VKHLLIPAPAFVRASRRFLKKHPASADDLAALLQCLESDPFASVLRTHKLKGALFGSWAASGGYDLRAVFHFARHQGQPAIVLEAIGTHDEVY